MVDTADTFRPQGWDEYVGQVNIKRELAIRIESALTRKKPLGHVLLCSPIAGVGKSALAPIIATALGEELETVTCPIKLTSLANIIRRHDGCVLLDEIHRCSTSQQEDLLPLLEPAGGLAPHLQMPNGRRVEASWLTIIATTTEEQKMIRPLVERFSTRPEFDPYSSDEMVQIVHLMARKAEVEFDDNIAAALADAANGTPRRARQFVLAYRDLSLTMGAEPSGADVLGLCRTTPDGLSLHHLRYLEVLDALGGGPNGLRIIASLLRMNDEVVVELERNLVERRYIEFSAQGRTLTKEGFARAKAHPNAAEASR